MTKTMNQSTLNIVLAVALTAVTATVGWVANGIMNDVDGNADAIAVAAKASREADAALLESIHAFKREMEHRLTKLEAAQ